MSHDFGDAEFLRAENARLREALSNLYNQVDHFCSTQGEADFELKQAKEALSQNSTAAPELPAPSAPSTAAQCDLAAVNQAPLAQVAGPSPALPVDCPICDLPQGHTGRHAFMPSTLPVDCTPERRELAKRAVDAQRNDTRTDAEIVRDGVSFILGPQENEGTFSPPVAPPKPYTDPQVERRPSATVDQFRRAVAGYGIELPVERRQGLGETSVSDKQKAAAFEWLRRMSLDIGTSEASDMRHAMTMLLEVASFNDRLRAAERDANHHFAMRKSLALDLVDSERKCDDLLASNAALEKAKQESERRSSPQYMRERLTDEKLREIRAAAGHVGYEEQDDVTRIGIIAALTGGAK